METYIRHKEYRLDGFFMFRKGAPCGAVTSNVSLYLGHFTFSVSSDFYSVSCSLSVVQSLANSKSSHADVNMFVHPKVKHLEKAFGKPPEQI